LFFVVVLPLLAFAAVAEEAGPARAPATRPSAAAVPEALVGDWFWGNVSPTRYWDADTGDFVGHGYSGALSYVFAKDGTYRRYFYLETRLGGSVSGIFSASEGTVTFTGDAFTLKPTKGTYRFTEGRSKKRERAMTEDELARPGLVFRWRLAEKGKGKPAVLVVGKEGEDEPREFSRSRD
jgi:hypothetical protein